MSASASLLIALGGNALQDPDSEGTYEQQRSTVEATASRLRTVIDEYEEVILTHGNGPQIGSILRQNLEAADTTPPMPLFVNGAQSQGLIGFLLQSALMAEFSTAAASSPNIVPIVTPVEVTPDDPAFDNPTKPIGPYLTEQEAHALTAEQDVELKAFGDDRYRQVVPSPDPQAVYGVEAVRTLVDGGDVPVVAGGGGVPIRWEGEGSVAGVNAVIDKDLSGALLASQLDVDRFVILTSVDHVALNYGEPDETILEEVTVSEARSYMEDGQFPRGSMYEKVEAACRFAESNPGTRATITGLNQAVAGVEGRVGTHIVAREYDST